MNELVLPQIAINKFIKSISEQDFKIPKIQQSID